MEEKKMVKKDDKIVEMKAPNVTMMKVSIVGIGGYIPNKGPPEGHPRHGI